MAHMELTTEVPSSTGIYCEGTKAQITKGQNTDAATGQMRTESSGVQKRRRARDAKRNSDLLHDLNPQKQ